MLKNIFVLTLILTTAQAWAQTPPAAPEKKSTRKKAKKKTRAAMSATAKTAHTKKN
jgi:prophage tail gpP-like protein